MSLKTVLRLLRRALPVLPPPLRRGLLAFTPTPVSLQERLAAFPTEGLPVERTLVIRWNEHHVPFIEAETDRDLAFGLGLVHQHLRAGQIALYKRFFYGRLSEMAGPVARELDHAIRILDYGHAAEEWERRMPAETHTWVQGFADGLNAYQARTPQMPPEFALLGLKPERYTFRDILVGSRFGGTDFTWLNYFPLLERRGQPGFATLWNRTLETGEALTSTLRPDAPEGEFQDLLLGTPRSGSNSAVISPRRSASGAAMIASDPHLGLSLPNLWILLGVRSPSFHAVGLSIAGLPMLALGRNPDLAWGGTNLRAASSDLYDVSKLPEDQITSAETVIRCRYWRPIRRTVRRSPFGPIISDAKMVKCGGGGTIALRWVGHEPNDEMSSFINCARARTPEQFRQAFAGYGVSGQNMLFCDRAGNIGHILAVTTPVRPPFQKDDLVLDATDPATHWQGFADCMQLPMTMNPKHGVLASANDRPAGTDLPIGFTYGSEDRIRRLYDLLSKRQRLTFDDLTVMQTDTYAPDAGGLAQALAAELQPLGGECAELASLLAEWDGDYAESSSGAVVFETFLHHVVLDLYGGKRPADLPDLYSQWTYLTVYLVPDLLALETERQQALLRRAASAAAKDRLRYATWGDMHRMRLAHGLARLPVVGGAFIVANLPAGGSRQTPMKMAHGLVNGRHAATFGSMARHISDMSDPDANWFVLLGGNDGWLGSSTYCDQLGQWQERKFIRMPLRPETVAAEFPIALVMHPAGGAASTSASPDPEPAGPQATEGTGEGTAADAAVKSE